MTSKDTGAVSSYHYKLLKMQKETESVGYFVLEHQPDSCNELPPNGAGESRNHCIYNDTTTIYMYRCIQL